MSSPCDRERSPSVAGHVAVVAQLLLVLVVVRQYDVATRNHFFPVMAAVVAGYVVRLGLPPRFRLTFFALLSTTVIAVILGWPNGPAALAIGGVLIGVCHLPVPFPVRCALACLLALALMALRIDFDEPFWPVLGSMFMFRLILYLYELRRETVPPPVAVTVAYFFPLQNVAFLFFPIVDFKTFRDTYRDAADWQAAQRGVEFLGRGLSHLLAYRVVKYYVLPTPMELNDAPMLALFLAANYALYLHVSAYFHLITGVFHLFGFALPRTHHHYFLASSFTDIWRRINIPWKEFMAKVFFFPAFFALRKLGDAAAVLLAAMWVFLLTWLLHAYQVFWITGQLPLNVADAGLWLGVGVLVAGNLLWDLKQARRPRKGRSLATAVRHAVQVVGMFVLVSVFWACWNTPWFVGLVKSQVALGHGFGGGGWVLAVLLAAVAVGTVGTLVSGWLKWSLPASASVALHVGLLGTAAVLSLLAVSTAFGPDFARRMDELRRDSLTPTEAAQATQGYYEEIAGVPVRAGAWFSDLEGRPRPKQQLHYSDLSRPTDDLLEREPIPDWSGEIMGSRLTLNSLGMRDRLDRTVQKPPGVRRIAVVGSSIVMGYGVSDDETFTRLLEDRLNDATRSPCQVLNFGTGKSFALHRRALIDRKVFGFDPDAVFVVGHQDEYRGAIDHVVLLTGHGTPLPYPELAAVVEQAGVTAGTPGGEAYARLRPVAREVVAAVYRGLAADCRRRGVRPVWVYLPVPGIAEPPGYSAELVRTIQETGFDVIDLSGWYGDRGAAEVNVAATDHHPNALGQRLIADRLADELRRRPELLSR